jgi:hypothetical protein
MEGSCDLPCIKGKRSDYKCFVENPKEEDSMKNKM